VNGEKVVLSQNIKEMKDLQEDYQEKIEELKRRHLYELKEKAMLKLEKDKIVKRVQEVQTAIKDHEEQVRKQIEASIKKQQMGGKVHKMEPIKGQNTPWPEDARPNHYLAEQFEPFNERASVNKRIEAHTRGIGGMALHARKQIIATASDDCTWKIWNMENQENIMTGEGHKDWIAAVDFHPAGSHLVTGGGDKAIKVWDFINSSIAHTFVDVHAGPIWKLKFHDTGDFVLSSSGDGVIKLFDLNSLRMRQQFRSHTDSVNGLNFQPFTNFFVSGSADRSVSIWDMRSGLTVQTFYGHLNTVNDTVFSIGGQYVASCDSDGILKLWDIRMVQELFTVDTGDAIAHCLAFDKATKSVAVGCSDAEIKMVNIEKGELT
jgi:WD40 repeat protein